eukprot:TRINITY_DN135_c0_g1_i11.p1 TRINITY_DN135_c0_g1~~TRINITY_DN135_c0_g1_i11.p1  ORF type:complete len:299 (+),score=79.47 TRINITY_DN135_c0_g1_i11:110-1006(+)
MSGMEEVNDSKPTSNGTGSKIFSSPKKPGSYGRGGNMKDGYVPNEKDLLTKMLHVQSKRYYLDVKENRRGKFIKVAEIAADGRRDQIFLALSTAAEFRDHLTTFSTYYDSLPPHNPETKTQDDGKLMSEIMIKDNRRYYLDLKENNRGRFLRVSQTMGRDSYRNYLAIPAKGMIEFRNALNEILDEFGSDDGGFQGELPLSQHVRVGQKTFHFDAGQNDRGIYLKVSEVQPSFRTAITIPEKSWTRFRDIIDDFVEKLEIESERVRAAEENGGSGGEDSAGNSGRNSSGAEDSPAKKA